MAVPFVTPIHVIPHYVDETMTKSDLIEVLDQLQFKKRDDVRTLQIDKGVRDFLIRLLSG